MSDERPFIVGIGGSPVSGSATERALSISLRAAASEGATTCRISGPDLILPLYTPGCTDRSEKASSLISALRRCSGVIIASPAYHGSVSGLVKNALDYTEDLRSDPRCYFDGLAVGCIACAGGWQAAAQTLSALRDIAHALRGWPTPLGAAINTAAGVFDRNGVCIDHSVEHQLKTIGRQVVQFAMAGLHQGKAAATHAVESDASGRCRPEPIAG